MAIRQVAGLIIEPSGEDHLVYNDANNSAHALNPMAYRVFLACDGADGAEQIANQLTAEGPEAVTLEVVWLALDELSEAGLIVIEDAEPKKVNRRDLILKIGVGAAAAAMLPVVEMIVAGSNPGGSSGRSASAGEPSPKPTDRPTNRPTRKPTRKPTRRPTQSPTRPTRRPTRPPTPTPSSTTTTTTTSTSSPTPAPTPSPTPAPSVGGAAASPKFTG